MASILIIAPVPVVRSGLRSLLRSAGFSEDFREAATTQEALLNIGPDLTLVIMDPREPSSNMTTFLRALREGTPGCPVLFFGGSDVSLFTALAFRLGVNGYLGQHSSEQTIAATARMILDGMQCFPQNGAPREQPQQRQSERMQSLSQKELTVLTLLRQGLRNKDVARQLFLSEKTISAHKRNILRKLGVASVMHISDREMVTEDGAERPPKGGSSRSAPLMAAWPFAIVL